MLYSWYEAPVIFWHFCCSFRAFSLGCIEPLKLLFVFLIFNVLSYTLYLSLLAVNDFLVMGSSCFNIVVGVIGVACFGSCTFAAVCGIRGVYGRCSLIVDSFAGLAGSIVDGFAGLAGSIVDGFAGLARSKRGCHCVAML